VSALPTTLPPELQSALVAAARRAHPQEACGLLFGKRLTSGVHVTDAREAKNVASDPLRRFELDPGEVVALHDEAARADLEVVGTWHSHPHGDPTPSTEDLAARWPGHVLVIVASGHVHVFGVGDRVDPSSRIAHEPAR
jgi:proteasome lid subunit RPN8/RPN11